MVNIHYMVNCIFYMVVSINGGTPIAGWFLFGKIPSFEMENDYRGTPVSGTSI